MTIISGPVKSIAYHPEVSEATAVYSASVIDVFEARRRLSPEYEGTAKEAEKEQGRCLPLFGGSCRATFISADEKGAIRMRNSRIPEFRVIC
jgi:hypothetical protein